MFLHWPCRVSSYPKAVLLDCPSSTPASAPNYTPPPPGRKTGGLKRRHTPPPGAKRKRMGKATRNKEEAWHARAELRSIVRPLLQATKRGGDFQGGLGPAPPGWERVKRHVTRRASASWIPVSIHMLTWARLIGCAQGLLEIVRITPHSLVACQRAPKPGPSPRSISLMCSSKIALKIAILQASTNPFP